MKLTQFIYNIILIILIGYAIMINAWAIIGIIIGCLIFMVLNK